jgi:hypothetical protein
MTVANNGIGIWGEVRNDAYMHHHQDNNRTTDDLLVFNTTTMTYFVLNNIRPTNRLGSYGRTIDMNDGSLIHPLQQSMIYVSLHCPNTIGRTILFGAPLGIDGNEADSDEDGSGEDNDKEEDEVDKNKSPTAVVTVTATPTRYIPVSSMKLVQSPIRVYLPPSSSPTPTSSKVSNSDVDAPHPLQPVNATQCMRQSLPSLPSVSSHNNIHVILWSTTTTSTSSPPALPLTFAAAVTAPPPATVRATAVVSYVSCPLCNDNYPTAAIEAHASLCDGASR